jgi:hypothetical protein
VPGIGGAREDQRQPALSGRIARPQRSALARPVGGIGSMLVEFTMLVLLGNIVGGTALFAVLSYAQVMKEI